MIRRAIVLLALVAAGCGPMFEDEQVERAYLNNRTNPTVDELRRRGELNERYKALDHERNLRQAEDQMNDVIGNLWSNSPGEKKAVEAYLKGSTERARAARGGGTAPP